MQLQKLVYIAHGWNLAVNGTPLVGESPQAWDWGPVYRDLYNVLSRYGDAPVVDEILEGEFRGLRLIKKRQPLRVDLSPDEEMVIGRVYDIYARFAAFQLSALTHQDESPWHRVYRENGRNALIDDKNIREHFVQLAQRPRHPPESQH